MRNTAVILYAECINEWLLSLLVLDTGIQFKPTKSSGHTGNVLHCSPCASGSLAQSDHPHHRPIAALRITYVPLLGSQVVWVPINICLTNISANGRKDGISLYTFNHVATQARRFLLNDGGENLSTRCYANKASSSRILS